MWHFNCVRTSGERVGLNSGSQSLSEMEEFSKSMEDMKLIYIPLVGRSCTRYRPNGRAKS